MEMGYSANTAVKIDVEEIQKLRLPTFDDFMETMESFHEKGVTLDSFAESLSIDLSIEELSFEENTLLLNQYEAFIKEFKLTTGIEIFLNYHDKDIQGDIYDQVNGYFFELERLDVYQRTESAENLLEKANFNDCSFVVYN